MGIKACKICGFATLRGEDFCYRHSNSQRALFVKKKWQKSVRKLCDDRERRISNFERQIYALLEFHPKNEAEEQRQKAAIKSVINWIRQIRRTD